MFDWLSFLVSGVLLGFASGISPGPLFTLVISETLRGKLRNGLFVALVPLVTDGPVVVLSFFVMSAISSSGLLLGSISLLGALFLAYLSWESVTMRSFSVREGASGGGSFLRGVGTNLLNPHMWVFWFSVGAPLVLKASSIAMFPVIAFIVGFFSAIVGTKIVLALLVNSSKTILNGLWYVRIIRLLGIVLFVFAVLFFVNGFRFLGVI